MKNRRDKSNDIMTDKTKGLWKIIFGRTTLLIIFLLIQLAVLIVGFSLIGKYIFVFNYIISFIAIIILLYILSGRQNASFKLTWIIIVLAIPIFGVVFYIFTRIQPGTQYIAGRIKTSIERQESLLAQDQQVMLQLQAELPREAGLARYIHDDGNYPIYNHTQAKFFPLGEDKFKEMLIQLEEAKKFIFMEYFIISKGYMWNTILEILSRKVKEGVEVRLMYDGTCTLTLLPPSYPKKLKELGIKCKVFAPIRPFLSTYQNNRDHRKILVIDGHTAFTGGVNLADEYINKIDRFGHWKDTAIMIKGKAVKSFTLMFLQMWDVTEQVPSDYAQYIPTQFSPASDLSDEGYVLPYGDSPYDTEYVGERVYMDILYTAKRYVHIMTPYLVLDDEMITALCYAAKRGVETIIIMPHVPDKIYAYLVARTYYAQLIDAGVQIYEYTPGFVHSKTFSSDDEKAVVGTINLDFRSLYLHFECAVYIYKNPVVADVEEDFKKTLAQCHKITRQECLQYNVLKKIAGRILRIIAPLM